MTLYIYNADTKEVVETVTGENQDELAQYAEAGYDLRDEYAATFTPGFGANDGLIETTDTKRTILAAKEGEDYTS